MLNKYRKKTRSLFWMLLFTVFFYSCSSTLEDRARKQMYKTLANEFIYANEFEISKENVIYNKDSVFIMLFHLKGKKDSGDITEGDMEYAYEEITMWAYDHPEVRVWDDYLREMTSFGENSVEQYLDNMKSMSKKGYSIPFKNPYSIVHSVIFSMNRKKPSEFSTKTEEYNKETKQ